MQSKEIFNTIIITLYFSLNACSSSNESNLIKLTNPSNYSNTLSINSTEYPNKAVIVTNLSTISNSESSISTLSSKKNNKTLTNQIKLPFHFITPFNSTKILKKNFPKILDNINNLKNENTTKNFYVFNFKNNFNYIVSANLKHSGTHCLIYATDDDENITDDQWNNIANFFDNTIDVKIENKSV